MLEYLLSKHNIIIIIKAGYSEIPTYDVEEGHSHSISPHSHSDSHAHDAPKSHEDHDHRLVTHLLWVVTYLLL
jgi:ABC-type Zn2+ transport system substrate-binding protein/surface adhesin